MKSMPLTGLGGKHVALVDDEDAVLVSGYHWYAARRSQKIYAAANVNINGHHTLVYMHRILASGIVLVDHRDGNGLNNCRSNLRAADHSLNSHNSPGRRSRKHNFKGITFDARRRSKPWRAKITVRGILIHLGRYETEEIAALAFDLAAALLHGEFAFFNLNRGDVPR